MSEKLDQQLIDAAEAGDSEAVERALLAGADVRAESCIALLWAASGGYLDVTEVLLKAGADIHQDDDWALRMASYGGHLHVVDLLLKSGADVHALDDCALIWSADNKHTKVVGSLLKAGADMTAVFLSDLSKTQIAQILQQHAASSYRGFESVMLLDESSCMAVLRHLHPKLKPKQMREELALMTALGLNAAQMAEMWTDRHGVVPQKQEMVLLP